MKKPAVFLDRDGTIIEDAGFLRSQAQVDFYPQTFPALRRLADFVLFIVTNQSGIAKGHIRIEEADAVNDYVVQRLAEAGTMIRAVYCCPHQRTDACKCMKPNSYFLRIAEREYDIDLTRSFVVGDHPSDVELANGVGATGIYVLTGHGEKHRAEVPASTNVVADIGAAADLILAAHNVGNPPAGLISAH
jgi:histidinol-phosphate phosphatase family protein